MDFIDAVHKESKVKTHTHIILKSIIDKVGAFDDRKWEFCGERQSLPVHLLLIEPRFQKDTHNHR